ncbi:MAG: outer membrane protein OmpA-like peptidoglycan-associated protein [Arenicella sp.]|jgi:outer membrane protein OmpA-like peptidoglycan-associated protein
MEKSRKHKFAVYALLMFLLLLCSGLGYYSYTLKSEKHSLSAKLNEYDDKLFRRDKELLNLMHKLDSAQDNASSPKDTDLNLVVLNNEPVIASEDVDEATEVLEVEDVILTPTKSIAEISEEEKGSNLLNGERDSLLIGDSYSTTEVVEVIKPKKVLLFNGKEINKGESVNLAVQFAPNSHILMKNSELLALVSFMQEHPNIIIKLSGHTQPNPSKDSAVYEETAKMHLGLSKKRVESVSEYLIGQGVSSEQIMTAHFGGSKPKYANANLNRRVEMKIIRGEE